MQITKLQIKNFRGIKRVDLKDLPPRVFITGMNGAGKSTILSAVQQCLYGRCVDQRGKRVKLPECVGPAGKEAVVSVTLDIGDGLVDFTLRIAGKGSTLEITDDAGKTFVCGDPDTARQAFWGRFGASIHSAECAGNPRMYLLSDDMPDLLGGLGSGEVDADALKRELNGHADWFGEYCRHHVLQTRTRANLEAIGKHVFAARTELNRNMKAREAELAALPDVQQPRTPDGQAIKPEWAPRVYQQVNDAEARQKSLLVELGQAQATQPDCQSAEDLQGQLDEAQAQKNKAEKRLAAQQRAKITAGERKKTAQAALSELDQNLTMARSEIARLETKHKEADKAAKDLSASECPRCGSMISPTKMAQMKRPAEGAMRALMAELHQQTDDATRYREQKPEVEAELAAATAEFEQSDAAGRTTEDEIRSCAREIASLERELKAAGARTAHRPVEDIQAELDELDGTIQRGRGIMQALQAVQKRAELQADIDGMRVQQTNLDWAVDAFQKGAILNTLGADGQAIFVERVNQVLTRLGHRMEIRAEGKDLTLMFERPGRVVPVWLLSDAELTIAQLAVGAAFGGQSVVLIDRMDGLDSQNKPRVLPMAEQIEAGSLWMAGAWGLPTLDIDGLQAALGETRVVWVDSGVAES